MGSETKEGPHCDLCDLPVDPAVAITWENIRGRYEGRVWFHWECFGEWGRSRRLDQLLLRQEQYPGEPIE